jgi:hypothetical protein
MCRCQNAWKHAACRNLTESESKTLPGSTLVILSEVRLNCSKREASCLNCFLVTARSPTFATGDSPGHSRVAKTALQSVRAGPGACSDRGQGRGGSKCLVGDPAGTRNLFRNHAKASIDRRTRIVLCWSHVTWRDVRQYARELKLSDQKGDMSGANP